MVTDLERVREFRLAMGLPISPGPAPLPPERARLHASLAIEELTETVRALGAGGPLLSILESALIVSKLDEFAGPQDLVEIADGCTDQIYIAHGTLLEFGLPGAELFAEVHRSNMTKRPDDKRPDGKIIKGPNYSPPDLALVLSKARAFAVGAQCGIEGAQLVKGDWVTVVEFLDKAEPPAMTMGGVPVHVAEPGALPYGCDGVALACPDVSRHDIIWPCEPLHVGQNVTVGGVPGTVQEVRTVMRPDPDAPSWMVRHASTIVWCAEDSKLEQEADPREVRAR